METDDLIAFLINIRREARKGYYSDSEKWVEGYLSACDDILIHLTGEYPLEEE